MGSTNCARAPRRTRTFLLTRLVPFAAVALGPLACAHDPTGFDVPDGEGDATPGRGVGGTGATAGADAGRPPPGSTGTADAGGSPSTPPPPPNTGGGGGGSTSGGGACAPLIDDMEHGDGSIVSSCGRRGYWYSYNDATPGATQTPAAGSAFLPEVIPGGRSASAHAAHTSGSGFAAWGAGVAFDFNSAGGSAGKMVYDASAYSAVSFWARTGGSSLSLRVNIASLDTDPQGFVCAPASKCNDHFGATVTVGAAWQQITVRFTEARQLGWGTPVSSLSPRQLLAMQFQLPAGAAFDLWIDDITFEP